MGIFSKQKNCPICNNINEVRIELRGGSEGALPYMMAKCRTCHYDFIFGPISIFIIILGFILALPLLIVTFGTVYIISNGNWIIAAIIATILAILIPELLLLFFIRSSIFDGVINNMIIKKAKKMIIKGVTKDSWGNSYKNSILYQYSPETNKITLK